MVALVLTIGIQAFLGRIYEIPSGSMEQTLHGCTGCQNDRVLADKVVYRFSDPAPGDVVIFEGPPAWQEDEDSIAGDRSDNPVLRTLQTGLSLIGLARPAETDFVKRVIAVGGQTVACCDAQNHVVVDGRPINEPYLNWEPDRGPPNSQEQFAPVVVPAGQLWVMGDNRNNSGDAREHGPIGIDNVIGRVRAVVLPPSRWRTIPAIDPQPPAH